MKFVIGFIVFYMLLVSFLFVKQRSLIYFPDNSKPVAVEGIEIVNVTTKDNVTLEAWYIPPKIEDRQIILLFHGNAGNHSHRMSKILDYLGAGYGVLLAEYRGYAGNGGEISEQGFYKDGRAYIEWLSSEKRVNSSRIVLYGESIGSGVATQMAVEYDVAGLILEAPFSSLLEFVGNKYFYVPVSLLLKDRFMNIDKISQINTSLLIMHGLKDEVIPFNLSEKLFKSAKDFKRLVDFPEGKHNNLYSFGASTHVLNFLTGINSDNEHNISE